MLVSWTMIRELACLTTSYKRNKNPEKKFGEQDFLTPKALIYLSFNQLKI